VKRADKKHRKRQAKMAAIISRRLALNSSSIRTTMLDTDDLKRLINLQSKAARSNSLGLNLAHQRLRRQLAQHLDSLRDQVSSSLNSLTGHTLSADYTTSTINRELLAIETEFDGIEIDLRQQTIAVITPAIELDDVLLGRFRIALEVRYLGESRPYRVIAIDPEHARDCDETMHPHVQSETLCEGAGAGPIKHALAEGRLFDFFVIVRQILQTYNPDSAYTRLSDWYGVDCSDCGSIVDRDDSDECERCSSRSCFECSASCHDCDRTVCGNCSENCESCGERYCDACLSSCRDCGESFCDDCLTKGYCDDCNQTVSETEAETQPNTQAATL